jgi:hypothetical protein
MVLVAIAALNLGAMRACYYDFWTSDAAIANKLDVLAIGSLPMANVLAVGVLIGLWSRKSRPFLLGFEAFGAGALVVYIALVSFCCHELVRPYPFRFQNPVFDTVGRSAAHIPIFKFTAAVILGWPQMAFALIGGFLSRKFGIAERPDRTRC